MSETKFTKGEWRVSGCGLSVNANGYTVARAHSGSNIPYTEPAKANAQLIATAPEMYADIENDIKELSHELNNKNLTPHARAHLTNKLNVKTKLLEKARGE